jgi:membrane fusion protein (multidrug efflux system)
MKLLTTAIFLVLALVTGVYLTIQVGNYTARDSSSAVAAPSHGVVPVSVEIVPLKVAPIAESVRAVGTLEANESVTVRPEIDGVIKRIAFTEGQEVERGSVLVELDDLEVKARLAHAESELKTAGLTYNRMSQCREWDGWICNQLGLDSAVVSQQRLDEANNNLRMAEASHTLQLVLLNKTKILAPFSGYIGFRRISAGDYVKAGQEIVGLEDLRTLKIDFKIPETFLSRLSIGQRVEVVTDAFPDRPFVGSVSAMDPRIDAESRSTRLRARIPNPERKLRPGLFTHVSLILAESQRALLIPEESVVHQGNKVFVYCAVNNTAHLREVQLGQREHGFIQLLDGLQAFDLIVRGGHQRLKDGDPIRPAESS